MSDCGVCISGWEHESITALYSSVFRRARKQHKCYECGRSIDVGRLYNRITGKWDNEFDSFAICAECHDIGTSLSCDGSRVFGGMWDEIEDYVFPEMTTGCLTKLQTASGKAFLLKRWREWKGLE